MSEQKAVSSKIYNPEQIDRNVGAIELLQQRISTVSTDIKLSEKDRNKAIYHLRKNVQQFALSTAFQDFEAILNDIQENFSKYGANASIEDLKVAKTQLDNIEAQTRLVYQYCDRYISKENNPALRRFVSSMDEPSDLEKLTRQIEDTRVKKEIDALKKELTKLDQKITLSQAQDLWYRVDVVKRDAKNLVSPVFHAEVATFEKEIVAKIKSFRPPQAPGLFGFSAKPSLSQAEIIWLREWKNIDNYCAHYHRELDQSLPASDAKPSHIEIFESSCKIIAEINKDIKAGSVEKQNVQALLNRAHHIKFVAVVSLLEAWDEALKNVAVSQRSPDAKTAALPELNRIHQEISKVAATPLTQAERSSIQLKLREVNAAREEISPTKRPVLSFFGLSGERLGLADSSPKSVKLSVASGSSQKKSGPTPHNVSLQ